MFKIKTMNSISPVGLEALEKLGCAVGADIEAPDGMLIRSADLHEYNFDESLLGIARAGAGYNNIPIEKCAEMGIVVFNSPGANAQAVKEQELCSLVMASRDVLGAIDWVRTIAGRGAEIPKLVEKGKSAFSGPELLGKNLGVIGLGAVGALVANMALELGMTVYGHDPFMSVEAAWQLSREVIRCESIEDIYAKADYISINVPYTAETHHMLNAAAVSRLLDAQQQLKERIAALGMANARMRAASFAAREGNICVFDDVLDDIALRELVNLLCEKCTGYAAAFSGSDKEGYRYIIGSRALDLRAMARDINAGIGGRGGGSSEMIQGRASKSRKEIQKFVESASV